MDKRSPREYAKKMTIPSAEASHKPQNADSTASSTAPASRPAVFFDRDGVLNEDRDFVHKIEDLYWIAGAIDAVQLCNSLGYYVFVVTNQSGVARGYYTEEAIHRFHAHMQACLRQHGAHIDAFAYCPHHPQGSVAPYAKLCTCRKPQPGMITGLLGSWPVDAAHSLLVGDKPRDVESAHAAGIAAALFSGGNLYNFLRPLLRGEKGIGATAPMPVQGS